MKKTIGDMHNFDHLIYGSTAFTLNVLEETHSKILGELQVRGATSSVKNLQMIRLQKAIMVVGMFSLFDSTLQMGLKCRNGFAEAKNILLKIGKNELVDRFDCFIAAINVLKHGEGKSYDSLIGKLNSLPFRIKLPDENFFFEGDVSEISTLIEVDDNFVLNCAELVESVSNAIRKECPHYHM